MLKKFRLTCKVIVSNIIYRSENGKASITVKNVNDHLDALNIDVVDHMNIGGNCLNNSGLHLNSTIKIDDLLIVFVVAQATVRKFLIK